ncbi:MAG: nodulation protein NfeD, partial [bacterium]
MLVLLTGVGIQPGETATGDTVIYHASVDSTINPVTELYVKRVIEQAEREGVHAILLQLNTPGGLMKSMNRITSEILNSQVPVIVWVGPAGSRAASAGAFITYASHVAAMSEGTRIGAAHPVKGQGKSLSNVMEKKVVNDAVAQIESMAKKRDRNETVARNFVTESLSLRAEVATNRNAVEILTTDREDLLQQLDGYVVNPGDDREIKLDTLGTNVDVREVFFNSKERFLNILVNPNLVYIFMMLGIYGLIYEFANPGVGLGLVVGGICLLLGLFGMSMLPISYTGLALLLLGIVLMVLDVFVPTMGVLTMGGVTSFVLGSIMLFRTDVFAVSYGLIAGASAVTVVFILVVSYLWIRSFQLPVKIGEDAIIGKTGTVKESLDPEGMVHVRGEYWSARSEDDTRIEGGEKVEVVDRARRKLT